MSKRKFTSDRALYPRILSYTEDCVRAPDIEDIVDYLQDNYGEYKRRKRNVLRKQCMNVLNNQNAKKEQASPSKIDTIEDNYLKKRTNRPTYRPTDEDGNEVSTDSMDEMDDEEELVEFKDQNAVNSKLTNLYRKPVTSQNGASAKENGSSAKENGTNNIALEEKPGKVPWYMDKSGDAGHEVGPIQMDLEAAAKNGTNTPPAKTSKNKSIHPALLNNMSHLRVDNNKADKVAIDLTETEEAIQDRIDASRQSTPSKRQAPSEKKSVKRKVRKLQQVEATLSFRDVGGCEDTLQEVAKLLSHLKHPQIFQRLGMKPPQGFLLHGPPGCGKTLLANAIAGEVKIPFFKIGATELVSGISGDSEQRIRKLFDEATASAPCIVFIDEIDSITPKRENASKDMERRVVTQLLTCMDEISSTGAQVLIIGATNRVDNIDAGLRRAGRFDREISMGMPDRRARVSILKIICRDLKLSPDFDYPRIADLTPGFVGADMQALCREAAMSAVDEVFARMESDRKEAGQSTANPTDDTTREELIQQFMWISDESPLSEEQLDGLFITTAHFEQALPNVQPSAKREGFATVPDVTWKDIGALTDIREELTMAIMAPVRNPEQFEKLGLTTPPGILLTGPPGCGKTLLAKAIANEAGINFISVKGPELLNMYVGESEKAVRQVFERARNSAPCVIFFDEIDALCPKRSNTGDASASSRVVNQLLTEMDGVNTRKQVFILGATNRPDIIDGAIMRPGRLDKMLYVGLPNQQDRADILRTITRNGTKPQLAADVDLADISGRCDGFSGADLAALVRDASVSCLKQYMARTMAAEKEKAPAPVSTLALTPASADDIEKETAPVSTVTESPTEAVQLTDDTVATNTADESMETDTVNVATTATTNPTETGECSGEQPTETKNPINNQTDNPIVKQTNKDIKTNKDIAVIEVEMQHFDAAFLKVKPSVKPEDRKFYEKLRERATNSNS